MVRMTLALCAAFSLSAPAPADAQASNGTKVTSEVPVSTMGLDIDTPAGAFAMYAKIKAAADLACHSDVSDPQTQNADKACTDKAISDAASSLRSPAVLALLDTRQSAVIRTTAWAPVQLASGASDVAHPATAIVDSGNLQPGSVRQPGMISQAWSVVVSAFSQNK